jgi:hypothetical protein
LRRFALTLFPLVRRDLLPEVLPWHCLYAICANSFALSLYLVRPGRRGFQPLEPVELLHRGIPSPLVAPQRGEHQPGLRVASIAPDQF